MSSALANAVNEGRMFSWLFTDAEKAARMTPYTRETALVAFENASIEQTDAWRITDAQRAKYEAQAELTRIAVYAPSRCAGRESK